MGKNKLNYRQKLIAASVAMVGALVAAPLAVSAVTANTTVSSVVSSAISVSSSGTVNLNATPAGSGVQTIASDTVSVSTNDTAGYTLQLAENGASSTLTSGGNSIAASTGTQTTPVAETANSWGYRVDGIGGFGAGPTSAVSNVAPPSLSFAPVPLSSASGDTLASSTSAADPTVTTSVWYGACADLSVPAGTYSDSVTYTAVIN